MPKYRVVDRYTADCNCWVKDSNPCTKFTVRFGAHCGACPQFRQSKDPVDRAHDSDLHAVECPNWPACTSWDNSN